MATILLVLVLLGALAWGAWCIYQKVRDRRLIEQVTKPGRGEWSERRAILPLLKAGIDPRAIFHDMYIARPGGTYTQVDLAVATKSGIIVFEVKNYSGWIFGNENQKYWTQMLAFGKEKHRFYNPIMQNAGHIKAIRECLPHNPQVPIYSVIVFTGNGMLKDVTYYSPNTYVIYANYLTKIVQTILSQPPAIFGDKHEVMNVFTQAVLAGDDPQVRQAQLSTAQYCARNTPRGTSRRFRFLSLPSPRDMLRNWLR